MTIRDYLVKRKNRLAWLMISVFVLGILILMVGTVMESKPLLGLGVVLFLAYIPAWYCYQHLVRCPRCKGNVGRHTSYFGYKKTLFFDVVNYCPFCGVQLDQPIKPTCSTTVSPATKR